MGDVGTGYTFAHNYVRWRFAAQFKGAEPRLYMPLRFGCEMDFPDHFSQVAAVRSGKTLFLLFYLSRLRWPGICAQKIDFLLII